ncbi:hypothetical protein CBS101457_003348 [Exobasidium rhododendri]|nr:hypothetical protein CBS101457_003348 [Exobasidium rhododendri]
MPSRQITSDGDVAMSNYAGQQGNVAAVANGMPGNPQQAQNLTQAFGQNAIMNLNALQAHYRGQPQAVVSYMEANIPGFRTLPIQMQLQQMTNVQTAALQRQRQRQTPPQQQQQQQQQAIQTQQSQQQNHLRRSSAAQSPVNAESPNARMGNRKAQSPMSMASASPGTPFQQQGGRPGTPASATSFLPLNSPVASNASPAHHLMHASGGLSYPSPSNSASSFAMPASAMQSAAPMMNNIPAHLQQQFLQQMQQQQQQQQQRQQQQVYSSPQIQPNGNPWQQQQPPPPPASG